MAANDERLARIASTLGVTTTNLTVSPPDVSTNVIVIDGAPNQFDHWADRVSDPKTRRRLTLIAGILELGKARRGEP